MTDHRVKGQPPSASGEDVLADPRWEALASGEATPEEVASLRAWAEHSAAARAAWDMFQPVDEVRVDGLASGVLRDLARAAPKARDVNGEDAVLAGRYRLLREISRGALASIWEAVDTVLRKIVAVKRLLPSPAQPHADEAHPLRREASALMRVAHPNIVELLSVGTTAEGEPFLVMPRMRGQYLSELLRSERRLDPAFAVRIAREIASALAAVHDARLIHRAIHPSNIFLQEGAAGNLVAMLVSIEFEQPSSVDALAVGSAMGFPLHLSPEQVHMRHDIDGRADIWSLGIVIYEMLTGTRPFVGSIPNVLISILTTPVPAPSLTCRDVPPLLDELVQRCTATRREERIQSAAEVQAMLITIEAKLEPAPSAPAPPYRAPPKFYPVERRKVDEIATTQCPRCGSPAKSVEEHCRICASRLGPSPLPPPAIPGFGLPPDEGFGPWMPASPAGFGPPPEPPAPAGGFGPPPPPPAGFGRPPAPPQPSWPTPSSVETTPRRALAGFLVSFEGDPLGKFWPLCQGQNTIGRADTGQQVDVEIPHGTVSTCHATIECEGGVFILSDLDSTNGTFHNGQAIGFKDNREIYDGDEIRFGSFSVIVRIVASVC